MKIVLSSIMLLMAIIYHSRAQCGNVKVIFDTDVGTDYDDVAALAVLHILADEGNAEILATTLSYRMDRNVQLIHHLNSYYGRPDLPIGEVKENGLGRKGSKKWIDAVLDIDTVKMLSASQTEDATHTYRKVLVGQPDNSVTIITVGFFTNLDNLLRSSADSISSLTGFELVKKKVKRLVSMAGRFPEGREFNIYAEVQGAKRVIEQWPTDIVFSGAEIGRYIRTGDKLVASSLEGHPVKTIYRVAMEEDMLEFDNSWYEMGGRASYAQTVVLAGVLGIDSYFNHERGQMVVRDDGSNTWQVNENGRHVRLINRHTFQHMANVIEEIMMRLPNRKNE